MLVVCVKRRDHLRTGGTSEDSIEMKWTDLVQGTEQWLAPVNTRRKLSIPQGGQELLNK
jgi:hypothetical protein